MDAIDLPADVLITALTSRLADLQCARVDSDSTHISAPHPQDGADRRALVAGQLLGQLERRLIDGSNEFVPVNVLSEHMRETLRDLNTEEVRFCARFLDRDREIRFRTEENTESRQTRSWSRLVRYQARFDRVKLSEAGRLFLKVLKHRRDWLYEDKHIETLSRALQSGLFDEIPRLSQEILSSLRLFNEQLTQIRESPSIEEMAVQYENRHQHFTDMLQQSQTAALGALELLQSQPIQERLEQFRQDHPDHAVSLGTLRRRLKVIHQATESLNRNWANLLADLQRTRRQRLGVLRFDNIITEFLDAPPSISAMESLLGGCCGWVRRSHLASVTSFIGSVEPAEDASEPQDVVFNDDPKQAHQSEALGSWLKQHSAVIMEAVRQGPVRLRELLSKPQLGTLPMDTLEDLVGIMGLYVISEPLERVIELEVICFPGLHKQQLGDYQILASDLAIQLRKAPTEAL
ncbi:MAG: hypothetical protein M3531_14580 [Pseudomonadota bacterium]|nr:hypothetical protein [Pseudomonadota bacterium]